MKSFKRFFFKSLMAILLIGTIPVITGQQLVHAEGPSDPAPYIDAKNTPNGKKILFDNTHGQTAGAADWVIDGGFSDFGNAVANQGFYVKELRKTTPITYDDLKDYSVFIIGEANIPYKKSEQDAMLQYVQNGGSIFFIADHYNADRNKNRWDASEVMNGYRRGAYDNPAKGMTTEEANSLAMQGLQSSDWLADNFGIRFRYNAVGDINATNVVSPSDDFGITNGVHSVAVHAGSTLAILDPHKAKGLVYLPALTSNDKWANAVDQGVYFGGGIQEGPIAAIAKVGKGKAAFIGDSSPVEDATPKYLREENGSKKVTYDGFKEEDDGTFLTNVVNWLSKQEDYTQFDDAGIPLDQKSPLLDSETPSKSTEPQSEPWAAPDPGYKWYDPTTFAAGSYGSSKSAVPSTTYKFVHQATLPNAEEFQIRVSLDNLTPGETVSGLKAGIYLSGGTQVGLFQNDDGSWPSAYGYSSSFSVTANALGHASKDLTVKIKPGTEGAASLRLKDGKGNNAVTESVTISDVPSEPLPKDNGNLPDLTSISEARNQKAGSLVTVQGVVTSEPGVFGGKGFYLQDDTGGIYVYQNLDGYHIGDQVKITAPLSVYNSELELSNPVEINKTGTADLPAAKVVTELTQENQGQLVTLKDVKIANLTPLSGAFEFDAAGSQSTTHVRVDSRTGLTYDQFNQQYQNGDVVNITGVSSIFKDSYQLKPLSLNAFEKADTVPPAIQDLDRSSFYYTEPIQLNVNVTDEGTGVAEVHISLDGKEVSNPVTEDPFQLSIGQHTLVINAKDGAGNVSTKTFNLKVIMDTDHLDEMLAIGYQNGDIQNSGIYNSLLSKVEAVQKNSGKTVNALENEVNAQKGKKISNDFAEKLLAVLKQLN